MSGKIRLGCEGRILRSHIRTPFQLLTLRAVFSQLPERSKQDKKCILRSVAQSITSLSLRCARHTEFNQDHASLPPWQGFSRAAPFQR